MYGQGDSILIRTKYNKKVLIDSGEGGSDEYDYGESVVLPYLVSHRINKIDYLVISHGDSDHIGGAFYLLNNFRIKNIIIGLQTEKNSNMTNLINLAKNKKINIIVVEKGDIIKIDNETKLEIFFPNRENVVSANKINNNSLVFKLIYQNFSMLFTGDIEKEGEEALLKNDVNNLKSDILKVAHHGSKTSSTEKFIKAVNPQIALISVGKDNLFGHPSNEVIKRFESYNVKILRTDLNGEIRLKIYRHKIKITSQFELN